MKTMKTWKRLLGRLLASGGSPKTKEHSFRVLHPEATSFAEAIGLSRDRHQELMGFVSQGLRSLSQGMPCHQVIEVLYSRSKDLNEFAFMIGCLSFKEGVMQAERDMLKLHEN